MSGQPQWVPIHGGAPGIWQVAPWVDPPERDFVSMPRSLANGSLYKRALAAAGLGNMLKPRRAGGAFGYDLTCPFYKWAGAHSNPQDPRRDTSTTYFEGGDYDQRIICKHESCHRRPQSDFWKIIGDNCPEAKAILAGIEGDPGVERARIQGRRQAEGVKYAPSVGDARALLREQIETATATGGVWTIDGTAGIGKTHTLAKVAAGAEKRVAYVTDTHKNKDQFRTLVEQTGCSTKNYMGVLQHKDAAGELLCIHPEWHYAAQEKSILNPYSMTCGRCEIESTCDLGKPEGSGIAVSVHALIRSARAKGDNGFTYIDEEAALKERYAYSDPVFEQAELGLDADVPYVNARKPDEFVAQVRSCRQLLRDLKRGINGTMYRHELRWAEDGTPAKSHWSRYLSAAITKEPVHVFVRRPPWFDAMKDGQGNYAILGAHLLREVYDLIPHVKHCEPIRLLDRGHKRLHYRAKASRRALTPDGRVDWGVFEGFLRTGVEDIFQHGDRSTLIATYLAIVVGLANRVPGSERCVAMLDDLRAHGVEVNLGYYGGLKGSNAYGHVDSIISLGDPWIPPPDIQDIKALYGIAEDADLSRRMAAFELMQVHGRARNVNRTEKFARHLHVGQVIPLDWTGDGSGGPGSGGEEWELTQDPPGNTSGMNEEETREAVGGAIAQFGSMAAAARALGVNRTTLWRAMRHGRIGKVAVRSVLQIGLKKDSEKTDLQHSASITSAPPPALAIPPGWENAVLTKASQCNTNVAHAEPSVPNEPERVLGAVPGVPPSHVLPGLGGRGRGRRGRSVEAVLVRAQRRPRDRGVGRRVLAAPHLGARPGVPGRPACDRAAQAVRRADPRPVRRLPGEPGPRRTARVPRRSGYARDCRGGTGADCRDARPHARPRHRGGVLGSGDPGGRRGAARHPGDTVRIAAAGLRHGRQSRTIGRTGR